MNTLTLPTTDQTMRHDYSELMSLALDGMLSPEEMIVLDQHLQACPACQASWNKWQRIARVLIVEPFAGPPQGFALRIDHALQHDEQRQERILAGLVVAGGTAAVLALMALGTALTTALWMAISPAARVQLVETLGFTGQFVALVFQNLASIRDGVVALLPDPVIMLGICLGLMAISAIWIRLVFYGARAANGKNG
jgi:anti-sigma factor RsiW